MFNMLYIQYNKFQMFEMCCTFYITYFNIYIFRINNYVILNNFYFPIFSNFFARVYACVCNYVRVYFE